jgi:single-strand DNA-binding protein
MNKVFMIGRLTADPITRNSTNNLKIVNIQLASEDNRDTKKAYFFGCTAFGSTAEFISSYIKKGDQIAIDGRLTKSSYVTKSGVQASTTDIIIESLRLLAKSNKNASTSTSSTTPIVEDNTPIESMEGVE